MEHVIMSRKEREQLIIFDKLKSKKITQVEASLRLGVTERWIRKKFKRYQKEGVVGLVHRNRGITSNKRWDEKEKVLVIELLSSEWQGFGPKFASEKLKELKGIEISKETLRQAMIEAGLWQAKPMRIKQRKRRERRAMTGLMVQLDGSPHDWFEGRAGRCTLLVFIDNATSKLLWLEFVKSESHANVMRATKNYVSLYGRPHSFYVDFGGVFSVNLNNEEGDKKTQWERAVKELSIEVIHAHSPQAKGRVERAHGTLQDRLVKEMRLAGICSIEAANKFLHENNFIAQHNQRFAISPLREGDAHKPARYYNLETIFCIKEERIVDNDYTISYNKRILSYNKRIFQLETQQQTVIKPKDKIVVNTDLNGGINLSIRNININFSEIKNRLPKKAMKQKPKLYKPRKPHKNSQLWAAGLLPAPTRSIRLGE